VPTTGRAEGTPTAIRTVPSWPTAGATRARSIPNTQHPAFATMEPAPRHQARERALTLLYEAELKGDPPSEVLDALMVAPDPFTATLVRTVESRGPEIDGLIDAAAIGWDLDRMAVVDRNVLRLAVAELLECPDVPTAVILNEAVELASAYSTDDSGRFVNGVLATLAVQIRG
jgi:N utilization substance protein B